MENKAKVFSSGIAIIIMSLLFIVPWFVVGLNIWGWFFVCVCLLLGTFELIAYKTQGTTLSGLFWKFMKANPKTGTWILISISAGWIILMLHLLHL